MYDVKHCFISICILYIFFGEVSVKIFGPFFKLSSVQFSRSVMSNSATPWITAHQASLSITSSWSSHKLTSIESVMPSSHLILCRSLLFLPLIPPSIRVFSLKLCKIAISSKTSIKRQYSCSWVILNKVVQKVLFKKEQQWFCEYSAFWQYVYCVSVLMSLPPWEAFLEDQ